MRRVALALAGALAAAAIVGLTAMLATRCDAITSSARSGNVVLAGCQ